MHRTILRLAAAVLAAALFLTGCQGGGVLGGGVDRPAVESGERQFAGPAEGDTIAIFDTSLGEVRAVLYPDAAPMAVENFVGLARLGYYDDTLFHRVVEGFVVQGGDPTGTGSGGASIWNGNPYPMEWTDGLHHYAGALCAAFSPEEETSGLSQFYFVQALPGQLTEEQKAQLTEAGYRQEVIDAYAAAGGAPYLDYTDTVFGQVYQGMEVVDAIAAVETGEDDRPLEDVVLRTVTIKTYTAG